MINQLSIDSSIVTSKVMSQYTKGFPGIVEAHLLLFGIFSNSQVFYGIIKKRDMSLVTDM